MADLTVTAASVLASASGTIIRVTAGETITAGMPVMKDTADNNEYKKAQGTSALENAEGIALNNASDGQPLSVCTNDTSFTPGATVAVGVVYAVSVATAGGIAPITDLTTGGYTTIVGVGKTTSTIDLQMGANVMRAQAAIA